MQDHKSKVGFGHEHPGVPPSFGKVQLPTCKITSPKLDLVMNGGDSLILPSDTVCGIWDLGKVCFSSTGEPPKLLSVVPGVPPSFGNVQLPTCKNASPKLDLGHQWW